MKDYIKCPDIIKDVRNEEGNKEIYLIIEILICIAAYFVIEEIWKYASQFLSDTILKFTDKKRSFAKGYIILGFIYAVKFTIYALFIRFVRGKKLASTGLKSNKDTLKNFCIGTVMGIVGMVLVVFICKCADIVKVDKSGKAVDIGVIGAIVFYVFLFAACYELFFRGYLLTVVAKKHSLVLSIVISSLVNAGVLFYRIGYNNMGFFNMFLLGVFTSLLFLWSERLWMPIAFHTCWLFTQGFIYGCTIRNTAPHGFYINTCTCIKEGCEFMTGTINNVGKGYGFEEGLGVTIILCIGIIIMLFMQLDKEVKE